MSVGFSNKEVIKSLGKSVSMAYVTSVAPRTV